MARLIGMPFSKYRHYEERLKDDHLPPEVYKLVAPILMSRGIALEELRKLLHDVFQEDFHNLNKRLDDIVGMIQGRPKD